MVSRCDQYRVRAVAVSDRQLWMLVTGAGAVGEAVALTARIGEGTRGKAVRRVEVRQGSIDLQESAGTATHQAYEILYREKYLDRQVVVTYEPAADLANVHGRSADLAFALAFALTVEPARLSIAATGVLGENGTIQPVDGLPQKITAALAVLPAQSFIVFPGANEAEVSVELRQQAKARSIALLPCYRLEEALRRIGVAIAHTWLECPFRGLEPFEFKHASIFFGREGDIDKVLSLLRRRAEKGTASVLVVGTSGSGKSSLVQAGVIPALLRRGGPEGIDTRWGILRPRMVAADIDPAREIASLEAAMSACWQHGEEGGLSPGAGSFMEWLEARSIEATRTRCVLVLDQMEEWLQGPLQAATVRHLAQSLAELAGRGVWLIGTLTSAAYSQLQQSPELAAIFGIEGQYALTPQNSAVGLKAAIDEPARAAGLCFEPGLDAELFAAASHGGADVLPLLELLLTELYERRDPSLNELRFEAYRAVGGLEGVVSARADAVHAQATAAEQATMPQLLWKLMTDGEVRPLEYPAAHPMQSLVTSFQARRLLVEDRDVNGNVGLRVAHEAFFRHWPRAVEQRRSDEGDIRRWLDLNRESGQWRRGERALVPPGPQLAAALALSRQRRGYWTEGDRPALDYVDRSARQHGRRQLLARAAIGVPSVVAASVGAYAIYDWVEGLYVTHIRFDDAVLAAPDYITAADPYLHRRGISVSTRWPETSTLLIASGLGLYGGRATSVSASPNYMAQHGTGPTAPVSYTLRFDRSVRKVRLHRAGLWPATSSGVTHPAWSAQALNEEGGLVAVVAEPLLRELRKDIPAKAFELKGNDGVLIRGVRIAADYRDEDGRPFAAFHSVLINQIDLVH